MLNLARASYLAKDAVFRARVAAAFGWVAQEVLTESHSVPYHSNRVTFAQHVIQSDVVVAYQTYATMVVLDPDIVNAGTENSEQTEIPDSMIIARVQEMWTYVSGVIPELE